MTNQKRNIIQITLGTALILLVVMIVNQFSDEVDWKTGDFIVMGILLMSAGLALEFIAKRMSTPSRRVAVAVAITITFLLVWAELAVGIFGSPFAGS